MYINKDKDHIALASHSVASHSVASIADEPDSWMTLHWSSRYRQRGAHDRLRLLLFLQTCAQSSIVVELTLGLKDETMVRHVGSGTLDNLKRGLVDHEGVVALGRHMSAVMCHSACHLRISVERQRTKE